MAISSSVGEILQMPGFRDDDPWKRYENPFYVAAVASAVAEATLNQEKLEQDATEEIQEKHCYSVQPPEAAPTTPRKLWSSPEIGKNKASAAKATGPVHEKHDERTNQKLRSELIEAWASIQKLERSHEAAQSKLSRLSVSLERGRSTREAEFQDKVSCSLLSLKQKLLEERASNATLSLANSKLEEELAEVRKSVAEAKRCTAQDVRARKVVEGVCDELAKEVGDDKSKVMELRNWSAATKKEAEECRKAMQMAEVWKEEKVQSRLAEARFGIESKSLQMDELVSRAEEFLSSRAFSEDEAEAPIATQQQDGVTASAAAAPCRVDETRMLLLNGSRFHHAKQLASRNAAAARSSPKLPRMWPSTSLRLANKVSADPYSTGKSSSQH